MSRKEEEMMSSPSKGYDHTHHKPVMVSESEPELTLQKLNNLIKSQLRLFLMPQEEAGHGPADTHENSHTHKRSKIDWKYLLEVLVCDIILLILSPFIITFIILNCLFRIGLNLYLSLSTIGKVRLMRGEDAFWASESPFNPGNFTSLYIIEGVPDLVKIRKRLSASWVERKDTKGRPMFTKLKLKAVQISKYFAWEYHTNFDLKQHVRFMHPGNPQRPIRESQLFEEMQMIYDDILPGDKPQWEVLLVPNYIYDQGPLSLKRHYALIFRVHHSIMDGLSAAQALRLAVADNVVEAGLDPMKPLRTPWYQKIFLYLFAILLCGPYVLRHNYQRQETNAFHGSALRGPKSLGWSRPIRLSAVKKLKDATHSSVTAVFISALGGAFKSLSDSKGCPPPEKVTAVTCAAFIPYPNIKAQNRFCVLFTPIDSKIEDAQERVHLAQEPFNKKLHGFAEVIMAYWIIWIGGCFPISVLNWLQDGICQGTVLLSNLPGPRSTAQIFGGDPIVDMVGWSPIRNRIGIAMCLFGYNGRVRANVLADSSVFPEPGDVSKFISCFEKEIKDLGRVYGLREEDCFTGGHLQSSTNSNNPVPSQITNLNVRHTNSSKYNAA